jgi:hypothetical protein
VAGKWRASTLPLLLFGPLRNSYGASPTSSCLSTFLRTLWHYGKLERKKKTVATIAPAPRLCALRASNFAGIDNISHVEAEWMVPIGLRGRTRHVYWVLCRFWRG